MPRKLKPFKWHMLGKLMDPPDADGEVFWITESQVDEGFPGLRGLSRFPHVQFIAGTKIGWIDPDNQKSLEPPIYRYQVEVHFRPRPPKRDSYIRVVRCWDAQGRFARKSTRNDRYIVAPDEEQYLGCSLRDGIWRALITGDLRDQAFSYDRDVWKKITPFLLEMSQAPEMQKMEELYLEHMATEPSELHTDIGSYDEGLSLLLAREERLLTEVKKSYQVVFRFETEIEAEHEDEAVRIAEKAMQDVGFDVECNEISVAPHELHTDTGAYDL